MNDEYVENTSMLQKRYAALLEQHGDGPNAVEQADVETQERRMVVLSEVGQLYDSKILDFGCATGHLLTVLQKAGSFTGEYVGYDICPELLGVAREKHPGVRFEQRDVLQEGVGEEFDFVIINGVFNNLVNDNWGWMTSILEALFPSTRIALSFNNLTRYVDYFDDHLFYADPGDVFRFCKEHLSPQVTLRHDYSTRAGVMPYEFSTYVYRSEFACRKLQQ